MESSETRVVEEMARLPRRNVGTGTELLLDTHTHTHC